jgi:uncharacterized protein
MLRIAALGCLLLSLLLPSTFALADNDPSLHQVYSAVQAGRLGDAQRMMDKVLHDHPNSAKAHYVEAEILAQQGLRDQAASELNNAERLEPGLPFVKPQSVQALKSRIAGTYSGRRAPPARSGFPWGMLLLGLVSIVIITLVVRAMNRRNASTFPVGPQFGPQPGMQPMYGNQPYGPMSGGGMGSSILGGLATGAAVGAGMVAGEELAHHFMGGNSGVANAAPMTDAFNSPPDLGGTDFGIADGSSWDDGSGFADMGGGNDWS